jgi:hypothetical protein
MGMHSPEKPYGSSKPSSLIRRFSVRYSGTGGRGTITAPLDAFTWQEGLRAERRYQPC